MHNLCWWRLKEHLLQKRRNSCFRSLRDLLCVSLIACVMVPHVLHRKFHSIYRASLHSQTSPFHENSYMCSLSKHVIEQKLSVFLKSKWNIISNLKKNFLDNGAKNLLLDLEEDFLITLFLYILFVDLTRDWVRELVSWLSSD